MHAMPMVEAFRFLARTLFGLILFGLILFGVVMALLLPGAALAADPSTAFYDAGMADPAFKLLTALFGTLAGGAAPSGGGVSGLAAAVKTFNSAILVAGSLFVTYNILSATAQTAHEGKILGRRYSSLWAPLRLVVASAALVPTASGFALIQHLTVKVAVLGIGLASTVWGGVFEAIGKQEIVVPPFASKDIYPVVRGVVLNYACVEMMNKQAEKAGVPQNFARSEGTLRADERGLMVVRYTWGGDSNYPAAICGALEWKQPEPPEGLAVDPADARGVAKSHQDALAAIDGEAKKLGVSLAQYGMSKDADAEAPGIGRFAELEGTYGEKLKSSGIPLKSVLEPAREAGSWLTAGALYMRVSTWTRFALDALGNLPKLEEPRWENVYGGNRFQRRVAPAEQSSAGGDAKVQTEVVDKVTRKIGNWFDNMEKLRNIRPTKSINPIDELIKSEDFAWVRESFPAAAGLDFSGSKNPMVVLTTYGHQLITTAWVMINASTPSSAGGATAAGDGKITAFASLFGPLFSMLLAGMFSAGGMFAVVLPMMPYVMWVTAVFGWLILVAEAVIAGPLWALAHLRMDGEGFAGGAGNSGYLITLSIFLRPSLMLIGLVVSSSLFFVGVQFVQATFGIAVRSTAMSGGVVGLVGFITLNLLLISIYTTMATRAFGLIHEVPDRVLRWIGVQDGVNDGGMAQQALGETQGSGRQAASAAASGSLAKGVPSGTDKVFPKLYEEAKGWGRKQGRL